MNRKVFSCCCLLALSLVGCGGPGPQASSVSFVSQHASIPQGTASSVQSASAGPCLQVGKQKFSLTWADTKAAAELRRQLPLAETFTEINGNEKYYKLSHSLPTADEDVQEIHAGDIMLYDGRYVVVFYRDFATTYRYTPLGHLDDAKGLADALGKDNVALSLMP